MRRRNVNPLTCCIDWSLELVVDLSLDPPWSGHTLHTGLDVLEGIKHQTTGV